MAFDKRSRDRAQVVAWVGITVALSILYAVLSFVAWNGSAEWHTLVEAIATTLAFVAGLTALTRYYSRKNNTFLFIGAGFIGTALLDGVHALATSSWFMDQFPTRLESLSPWSWLASRWFLSISLLLSWLAWRREERMGPRGRFRESAVYVGVALLTLAGLLFIALVPLPEAHWREWFFHRPAELVPALFFLIALGGYLHKNQWRGDEFEPWLVASLIVNFLAQALFISRSGALFDGMFQAAHLLKIVAYGLVLTGLLASVYATFRMVAIKADLADAALRQSRERLRRIIDSSLDAMISIDERGEVIEWNPRAEQMFGWKSREAIGRTLAELIVPPGLRTAHQEGIQRFLRTGHSQLMNRRLELTALRRNRSEFAVELAIAPLPGPKGFEFSAFLRDISDRKALETAREQLNEELESRVNQRTAELQERNQEMQQFAYVASHDLQEPLRKVVSCCQVLCEDHADQLSPEARKWLDFAVDGSRRMQRLVSDLLTWSRVGTRGRPLGPVDAEAACRRAIGNLQMSIEESGAKITIGELPMVMADEPQLVQLLQNLISNAVKYRGDRTPEIEIGAEPAAAGAELIDGNPACTLFVRDNGIGISAEYFERIFVIFQRLHRREEYSGTGIGLAICRKIVQRHGGEIRVDSVPGEGSTFSFTIATALPTSEVATVREGEHATC